MSTFREANGVSVFVREYLRLRLGKWETVKSHLREWPCGHRAKSK